MLRDDAGGIEGSGAPTPAAGPDDPGGLVGTVIAGRYRILSLLGVGAMGAVYLGEHLKIGRRDAIKVLRPQMARDEEAIARFTRGARHASGIRHPNVCAIYDFGTTERDLHFLAMEFVDGGSLSEVLSEEGRLELGRAAKLLEQAAGALQAAHDRGIVHRDLKPDNIMLSRAPDGSEQVKVVDFDIALGPVEGEGARVTRHGYVVGTPEYMSPEQLTGDPLDARSDVYSLALVFFRALTGRLPFDAGTAQEVMVRRLTVDPLGLGEAAPDARIPEALEPVIRTALARRAEDRYPSAADFTAAVRAALSGTAATSAEGETPPSFPAGPNATPEPAPIPPTRVSSTADDSRAASEAASNVGATASGMGTLPRKRLLQGGIAGVLLLAAVGGGLLLASGDSPPDGTGGPSGEVGFDDAPASPGSPGASTSAASDADAPPDGAAIPDGGTFPPPAPTGSTPATAPPEADAAAPAVGLASGPTPPSATPLQLPGEDPADILIRQLLAQDDTGGGERNALEAIRDTTYAIWNEASMSRGDSALASYILGSTLIPLGDSVRGVGWLEEAVRLEAQRGYVELLELHGGRTP